MMQPRSGFGRPGLKPLAGLEKGKLDAYSASASASPSGTMAAQTKIRGIGDKLEVWSEAKNVELGLHAVSNDERSDEKGKYSSSASTKSGKRGNAKASVRYLGGLPIM